MVRLLAISVLTVALANPVAGSDAVCAGLAPPVDGSPVRRFAPDGRYSGHWGVDWGIPVGTSVAAAGPGTISFTGVVAGNLTVTVDHGGGLRTSYSYLGSVLVEKGQHVDVSSVIGTSGRSHGFPGLHFSVRVGDTYVDPLSIIGCRDSYPSQALRLVPVRLIR